MKLKNNIRRPLTFLFLCFFSSLFSQDNCDFSSRDTEILINNSIGYGYNMSEATLNAKRNAIAEAVGSYIQTETTISNDKIDQDKIYEYGKGLVQKFCIKRKIKQGKGFEVTIKAVVTKEKILETLYATGVEVTFPGEELAQTMFSEGDRIDNERLQVEMLLNKINPGDAFTYTIKDLGVKEKSTLIGTQKKIDRENKILKIAIAVKPNYKNYIRNIENALKNIADISITDEMILSVGKNEMIYFPFDNKSDQIASNWFGKNKIMFINKVYKTFPSKSLTSIFKSKGRFKNKKEKFLKKYKGLNYHLSATLISFYDPTVFNIVNTKLLSHLEKDNFSLNFKDNNGNNVLIPLNGVYNNFTGKISFSDKTSTNKSNNYENFFKGKSSLVDRTKSNLSTTRISYLSTEYTNLKKEQFNSLLKKDIYSRNRKMKKDVHNNIQYLTNIKGSYNKERFYSTLGTTLSVLPFIDANSRKNSWSNSNIQPHGFSSNYNPWNNYYVASSWIAALSGTTFAIWRASLRYAPRKVLKTGNSESVVVYNSDTDYLKNNIELNAFKLEKIDKTDEIYNWEIFKEPNNTIAVFILEIPIKLDDLSKIAKIEVK